MKKIIINGGKKLGGGINISGAKNVALKAIVAACLTSDEVIIHNIPLINDLFIMMDLVGWIGGKVNLKDHTLSIRVDNIRNAQIPLDIGAKIRTSSMFLAPLLARSKTAIIPNPGGCRIGARPIDRHIKGLEAMGASITYHSEDGYFHAKTKGLKGASYSFDKNSHTGTETLIIAATLAEGRTVIENAATEPEVDDLIKLLNQMGAVIKRKGKTVVINGVEKLHGTTYTIPADRNEVVTFAIASALTSGNIWIKQADLASIPSFLEAFKVAGGDYENRNLSVRFFMKKGIRPTDITTSPHPGFMTDWQAPWAVFMTQADGLSSIHETVYENRFGYVEELKKMGARISFYIPNVSDPKTFYNFNDEDTEAHMKHAIKIRGKTKLHNAVLTISDLRAGATLVLASLIASGQSIIYGVETIDRGYEKFVERLRSIGADIQIVEEKL